MDLSKISVEARIRNPWEAMDLGFVMAREWWKPVFLSWFIPSFCVFLPMFVLAGDTVFLALILWWLKPLFDRGPLFIASRRLFGEEAGIGDFFREWWAVCGTDLLLSLTLRRLSPTRSFDLPLAVLEKVTGQRRSSRQMVLHRVYAGAATWLTIVALFVELLLYFAIIVLLLLFIPDEAGVDSWQFIGESGDGQDYLYSLCVYLAMVLVGPFYSVAGFAMYINRRIELEAWDVEIRFRHLVRRAKPLVSLLGMGLLVGACSLFCALPDIARAASPADVYARDDDSVEYPTETAEYDDPELEIADDDAFVHQPALGEAAKTRIFEILEGDDFNRRETVSGWRFKEQEKTDDEKVPDWLVSIIEFFERHQDSLQGLGAFLASPFAYMEYLLLVLLLLLVAFIAYRFRAPLRQVLFNGASSKPEHESPKVMFGLDVTRESLPDDIPSEVLALWHQSAHRQAISLLYRALLAELIHRHGFRFADSFTEGECVAMVNASAGETPLAGFTVLLTGYWQNLAYGHRLPPTSAVEGLCQQWREVFTHE